MDEKLQKARALVDKVVAGNPGRAKSPDPDFSEISLRLVFGELWSRPGLSLEERRIVVLSLLIALGRKDEFKMHVGNAVYGGMDRAKIKEIMLQSMAYCGVPAALDAFNIANEVYAEIDAAKK